MAYPHSLATDVYYGRINQIDVSWHETAKARLPINALLRRGDASTLKSAVEHFAYSSATRLGKERVTIRHENEDETRCDIAQAVSRPDAISLIVSPGQWRVHVCLDGIGNGPAAFDNITMTGESVVLKGKNTRHPDLSVGVLPL